MNRLVLSLTAAAAVLATGALAPNRAEAFPLGASTGPRLAIEELAPIENVAICFYLDGWNGPGLYECGFRRRHGEGWHGPRDNDGRNGRNVDRDRRSERPDRREHQTEGRGRF